MSRRLIYTDASLDHKDRTCLIGWTDAMMVTSGHQFADTTDINEGEFQAIQMAVDHFGVENIKVLSDSETAIERAKQQIPGIEIEHVRSKYNLADTVISLVREDIHRISYHHRLKRAAMKRSHANQ